MRNTALSASVIFLIGLAVPVYAAEEFCPQHQDLILRHGEFLVKECTYHTIKQFKCFPTFRTNVEIPVDKDKKVKEIRLWYSNAVKHHNILPLVKKGKVLEVQLCGYVEPSEMGPMFMVWNIVQSTHNKSLKPTP